MGRRAAGLAAYGRRLVLFPVAYSIVELATTVLSPWFLWRFEAELERVYQEGLGCSIAGGRLRSGSRPLPV